MQRTIILSLSLFIILPFQFLYAAELSYMIDITYESSDGKNEFSHGAIDMFGNFEISDDSIAFLEIVVSDKPDGSFGLSVERHWVQKDFHPLLKVSAGRHHSPLGYYVRQYHHGALLDMSTARPAVLTHVVPLHIMGILMQGEKKLNLGVFGYEFAFGNGPSLNTNPSSTVKFEANDGGDPDNAMSYILRLHSTINNVDIGTSFMTGEIAETGAEEREVIISESGLAKGDKIADQTFIGLDFRYTDGPLAIHSEFLTSQSKNALNGVKGNTRAFFAQAAWTLGNNITVAYRYEDLTVDASDIVFTLRKKSSRDYHVAVLRCDMSPTEAIKLVYQKETPDGGASINTLKLQWAFMIP